MEARLCPSCGLEVSADTAMCPRDGTTIDRGGDVDPLIGRTIDDRYRIGARIGAGNVGAVYDARHVELGRRVAIKVLHASLSNEEGFEARFVREARSVSRLNHPGCVALLDFGRVARVGPEEGGAELIGMPYLVMEHVAGELLLHRIDRGGISAAEAIRIVSGALRALRHAHGLQIVHRDIKPGNIILCAVDGSEPLVKLVDFGLAKDLDGGSEQAITQAGMVFGTPAYLSPEQARGEPADGRSDLYSLAVVLFEMLAGRKPFVRDTALELVKDHLLTPAPLLRTLVPTISIELEGVVRRALDKDAGRRYASADDLLAALHACPEASRRSEAGSPSSAELPPSAELPSPRRAPAWRVALTDLVARVRRHRMAAASIAAALLLVTSVLLLRRSPEPTLSFTPTEISLNASPSARRHLALAEDYQRRLWCTDAIDELGRALKDAPALRESVDVVRIALPCLRPKSQQRTLRFLVDQLGDSAIAPLKEALTVETRPEVRDGITRALLELDRTMRR